MVSGAWRAPKKCFCGYCCCPSEWVSKLVSESECNNRIRAHNELYRFRSDIPWSWRPPRGPRFLQSILLSYFSRPSVVKYGILSNNRRNKLTCSHRLPIFTWSIPIPWPLPVTVRVPDALGNCSQNKRTETDYHSDFSLRRSHQVVVFAQLTYKRIKNSMRAVDEVKMSI